jgi:hypothetical protein
MRENKKCEGSIERKRGKEGEPQDRFMGGVI